MYSSIGKSVKIPSKNGRLIAVPDEVPIKKTIKFTTAQIEAIQELSDNGVFKTITRGKVDPDIVYRYPDFSTFVRDLIAKFYEAETGESFPPDPERGNPDFR